MELRAIWSRTALYQPGGAFLEQAAACRLTPGTLSDMSAIYEDMGLDYGALMEMTTGDVDYTALCPCFSPPWSPMTRTPPIPS